MPPAAREWRVVPHDAAAAQGLAGALGLSRPVASLLCGRGLHDPATVRRFLDPRLSDLSDPFRLPAMRAAVDRILRALRDGEQIVVYGDYDVDGVSSTSILVRVLRALGGKVDPFLPLRLEEGYGLGLDALDRCLAEFHPALIVTVDCGTGSAAAVREAARRGVDVVVTDHHEPGAELAPAVAVVNPKLGADEAAKTLAGVGVAFKLAHALVKEGRAGGHAPSGDLDLRQHLDLVALGTIADIVPLREENRILAHHGLLMLGRTSKPGLRALAAIAGIGDLVDAYDVGFKLGPRLNAAGRLGDAQKSLELLLSTDDLRCAELAQELDLANRERQELEARILREALADVESRFDPARDFGLVVAGEGWHAGVIGIVASRLVQRYGRPAICIALDEAGGRGSCRSVEGFDLAGSLAACGTFLLKHGGHAMAAGLEIDRPQVAGFQQAFNERVREFAGGRELLPVQKIDAWLELAEADARLARELDPLRPFGCANATPVWGVRQVRLAGKPRVVGKGHLKFAVTVGGTVRDAIAFNRLEDSLPDGPMDLAFQLKQDTYMGREQLTLNVQDIRPSAPLTAGS